MSGHQGDQDDQDGPARYRHLSFNAPLSGGRADRIAGRLATTGPRDVLDLGCGWGELLLRVLERAPAARGRGVDTDERLLQRARVAARERGLTERVTFTAAPAGQIREPADVVMCVGASHALGGTAASLAGLHTLTRPGGRALFGDGLWDPRTVTDRSLVWEDFLALPDLGGLVDLALAAGFRPLHIETSTSTELDAFESGYLADFEEWLMEHPGHPDAGRIAAAADDHRKRWLHGYRAGFGFAYLTLGRPV